MYIQRTRWVGVEPTTHPVLCDNVATTANVYYCSNQKYFVVPNAYFLKFLPNIRTLVGNHNIHIVLTHFHVAICLVD
jgi:hypothetical protein